MDLARIFQSSLLSSSSFLSDTSKALRLLHSGQCRDIVRMVARSFLNLSSLLEEKGGLRPSRRVRIHELVARFLYAVGHNEKHCPTAFYWWRDYVGAIDGTHVRARVDDKEAPKYRGRKYNPTMNALAACTFDLKFTYVLVGWEGTVSDSKMIKNALTKRYPLKIPQGKYYLVDAGFMIKSGLIFFRFHVYVFLFLL
ncbi:uncharacterized protein LOC144551490 [Carex rostrata]